VKEPDADIFPCSGLLWWLLKKLVMGKRNDPEVLLRKMISSILIDPMIFFIQIIADDYVVSELISDLRKRKVCFFLVN